MTDSEGFNELILDTDTDRFNTFRKSGECLCMVANSRMSNSYSWSYREDEIDGKQVLFYTCGTLHGGFEVSLGLNAKGELHVLNIIPLFETQLTASQYNKHLVFFRDMIINLYNSMNPTKRMEILYEGIDDPEQAEIFQYMLDDLKEGDLVNTCDTEPGFIVSLKPNGECEVYNPHQNKITSHHVYHCGIKKISWSYASLLWSIGDTRLQHLYRRFQDEGKEFCYDTLKDYAPGHAVYVVSRLEEIDKIKGQA